MPLVSYSPWTDAAQYGAGLGATLGQAMMQMPQQRLELAQQAYNANQRQEIARQQLAQQQQEAQAQQSLGLGQLALHRQEMQQSEQMHQLELAEQRARTEAMSKGTWKVQELPDGTPVLLNTTTGEHRKMDFGQQQTNGLGAIGKPATQGQQGQLSMELAKYWPMLQQAGLTNNPVINNLASNLNVQALGQLGQRFQGAPAPGLAPTNTPAPFKILQVGQ